MLMVILPDQLRSERVMDAWMDTGVTGVTILDSAGISTKSEHELMDDLPLIPSLSALLERGKVNHITLFTIINDEALLERAIKVATTEAGGFDSAEHGIMLDIPVSRVWGIKQK
jgi:hypothetical protein